MLWMSRSRNRVAGKIHEQLLATCVWRIVADTLRCPALKLAIVDQLRQRPSEADDLGAAHDLARRRLADPKRSPISR